MGDTAWPFAASLAHVMQIGERRAALAALQLSAEDQLLAAIGREWRSGAMTLDDLCAVYVRFRTVAVPPHGARWDTAVGVPVARLAGLVQLAATTAPNGPSGSWHGPWPLPQSCPAPPHGTSVVYVLYDAVLVPCYVGSTGSFRARLRSHRNDGKDFTAWHAYPAPDRDTAYALEDRLLRKCKPYLNRKASR